MNEQVKEFLSKCWTKPATASYLERATIEISPVIRIKIKDQFTFTAVIRAKSFVIKTAKEIFGPEATVFIEKV